MEGLKKILKYGIPFSLAGVLLYFAFRGVDWKAFVECLRGTDWRYILMLLSCSLGAFCFRALRWRLLLRPVDTELGHRTVLDAVCIGNMANCAIPFLGEFVRAGAISKRSRKAGMDRVLGTIVLERCWDLAAIVLIVLMVISLNWNTFGGFFSRTILGPAVGDTGRLLIGAAAVVVIGAAAVATVRLRGRVKLFDNACRAVEGIFQGIATCWRMKGKVRFVLYTLAIWGLYWGMCVAISLALPEAGGLTLPDTLFVMAVGNFASVVPVPGGFGAYHYLVALTLSSLFGLSWEAGIAFATLCHESQAICMITTGLLASAREAVIIRKQP